MFSVAIDGPSGAGKSSIAKSAAKKLGFIYVDTGALYRSLALHLLQGGVSITDAAAVEAALPTAVVTLGYEEDGQHVYLGGVDVSEKIRTAEVAMAASTTSAVPAVRAFLFHLQTDMAQRYNVIMDGRDIGTLVLPFAQAKIFLTASPEVRAKRRFLELSQKEDSTTYAQVLADVIKRDYQDSTRAIAPLKPAEDAILLDTTALTFEESVAAVMMIVEEKQHDLT